jgi:cytosine/creatinine deaminase
MGNLPSPICYNSLQVHEVAAYLCHVAHMTDANEIEAVFDFITYNAALALHLEDYSVEPGCRANLNVLATPTLCEVLRLQQPLGWVIRLGKVLARNQLQREFVNR